MKAKSLQEQNKIDCCFGCGTQNSKGLKIKSYESEGQAICTWQASAHHGAGRYNNMLYGGIIASLIDCHSINLAICEAYKNENRKPGSRPILDYVTARLEISYIKPCPTNKPLSVQAKLLESKGRKSWVESEIRCEGVVCAKGKVLAVRVNK